MCIAAAVAAAAVAAAVATATVAADKILDFLNLTVRKCFYSQLTSINFLMRGTFEISVSVNKRDDSHKIHPKKSLTKSRTRLL